MINEQLKKYIEDSIFPMYEKNDKGHNLTHINYTLNRAFEIIEDKSLDIDLNIMYVIVPYHDIGHFIDKDNHEKISAEIMMNDTNLRNWFNEDTLILIKEAIEDHRASNNSNPRSIYGDIMRLADKNVDLEQFFFRASSYSLKHFPDYTEEEHIERIYEHGQQKFGEDGYAKLAFTDQKYEKYLADFKTALKDKESFKQKIRKFIRNC